MRLIAVLVAAVLTSAPVLASQEGPSSASSASSPSKDADQPTLPVSLAKIREALAQAPVEPLKGMNEEPHFRVEIQEWQKFKAMLDSLKFDSGGPSVPGGPYAYDQQQRLFPKVDNPLVQPYAAFNQGELLQVMITTLMTKYLRDALQLVDHRRARASRSRSPQGSGAVDERVLGVAGASPAAELDGQTIAASDPEQLTNRLHPRVTSGAPPRHADEPSRNMVLMGSPLGCRLRSPRLATLARPGAIDVTLSQPDIERALAIARSTEAERARFHSRYRLPVSDATVAQVEAMTEFRRVVIAGEDRLRQGDWMFTQGTRAAEAAVRTWHGQITMVAQLRFNPLNTYVTVPVLDIMVGDPLAEGVVTPLKAHTTPQYFTSVPVPGKRG